MTTARRIAPETRAHRRAQRFEAVMRVRREIGAEGYDLHALRYSATAELAAAGCTDEQIQSITGHATSAMVKRYAGPARQRARAKQAQEKRK